MKISFCFEAIEFQRHFLRRPSKVRKLVRMNQFQVESTKIGTVRKFVTLQYLDITLLTPIHVKSVHIGGVAEGGGGQNMSLCYHLKKKKKKKR